MKQNQKTKALIDEIDSKTILLLRFPLAVLVVFIHNFGDISPIDLISIKWSNIDALNIYNLTRSIISRGICLCAVPAFFLISGWLFFQRLQEWNWVIWKDKVKKRKQTLVLPYIAWNIVCILNTIILKLAAILFKGKQWDGLFDWFFSICNIHTFWDCFVWETERTSLFGVPNEMTGPIFIIFWFIRDLIFAVIISPITWWLIKKFNLRFILPLTILYLTFTPLSWHGLGFCYWFCIGSWLAIQGKSIVVIANKYYIIGTLGFIATFIPFLALQGSHPFVSNLLQPTMIICLIIILFFLTSKAAEKSKGSMVAKLNNTTFFIFAAHMYFLPYINQGLQFCFSTLGPIKYLLAYLISPFVTIILCIILFTILQHKRSLALTLLGITSGDMAKSSINKR